MALRVEGEPDAAREDVDPPAPPRHTGPRRSDGRALQRALRTRELPQEQPRPPVRPDVMRPMRGLVGRGGRGARLEHVGPRRTSGVGQSLPRNSSKNGAHHEPGSHTIGSSIDRRGIPRAGTLASGGHARRSSPITDTIGGAPCPDRRKTRGGRSAAWPSCSPAGPRPAANAVISTAAASFLSKGIEVVGILNGYSHLVEYGPDRPLQEGRDYIRLDHERLRRTRNSRGIMIGTARTNPGKDVAQPRRPRRPRADRPARAPSTRRWRRWASTPWSRSAATTRSRPPTSSSCSRSACPTGCPADRGRPRPQDDRQRLSRHRLHVRLLHGRRDPGRRDPQPAGRRRGDRELLPRRDHGPHPPAGSPTARPSPARPAW